MVKKRVLSPKSVWDEEDVSAAFQERGIKPVHLKRLYRCALQKPLKSAGVDCTSLDRSFPFPYSTWLI
jgi:hypothetical protein